MDINEIKNDLRFTFADTTVKEIAAAAATAAVLAPLIVAVIALWG